MSSERSKDIALIVGLAIPLLMIVFVAAAIYLPRVFSSVDPPQHDFLYLVGSPYGDERYLVVNGRLTVQEVDPPDYTPPGADWPRKLYLHHVAANTSEPISFEAAAKLTLDSSPRSPDGFEIVYGRRSEFFFPILSTTDYQTRYLQQDGWSRKLDLEVGLDAGYASMFNFLGWIVEEAQWTR
jgi:hypothetical protein